MAVFIFLFCVLECFKYILKCRLLEPLCKPIFVLFCFSWKVCVSPSIMKDRFAGYSKLDWQLFLLGLEVYHLMSFLLLEFLLRNLLFWWLCIYIYWFFLAAFNILVLYT
jgi:hypothetical protein